MNTYEFLTQSPKAIGRMLKIAGIVKYGDVPADLDKLNDKLKLTPDSRVRYCHTITRGGATEWYFDLDIDFGFGVKRFDVELYVNGKCSVRYARVGGYHTWAEVYDKECPLFDDRPQYHNLELCIKGEEYAAYEKSRWDNKMVPAFDDNKPLSEYIDTIKKKAHGYKPFVEMVERACLDGEYVEAYNRYNFNPFKPGDEIMGGGPGFASSVYIMYNAKDKFNIDLTMDDVHALHSQMMRNIKEVQAYFKMINESSGCAVRTIHVLLYYFFYSGNGNDDMTAEMLTHLLGISRDGRINKDKESWESVLLDANRDFYNGVEKLRKELAEKHGIPEDYIHIFNYDEKNDAYAGNFVPEMPKELEGRFGKAVGHKPKFEGFERLVHPPLEAFDRDHMSQHTIGSKKI